MKLYRRVLCVCRRSDEVLLACEGDDAYWILPGGGVEEGETYSEAFIRELGEELGLTAAIENPAFLFMLENFYSLNGESIHELSVAFQLPEKYVDQIEINYCEFGHTRLMRWHKISDLPFLNLMPSVLPKYLDFSFEKPSIYYGVSRG